MNDLPASPRIALIACRVLDTEIAALTSPTRRIVHRMFFDIGLHDQPALLAKHSGADYTDHGLPGGEVHRCYAHDCSRSLGWRSAHHPGDPRLLRQLRHGPWPAESLLVTNPGEQVAFAPDATVVKAVPTVMVANFK